MSLADLEDWPGGQLPGALYESVLFTDVTSTTECSTSTVKCTREHVQVYQVLAYISDVTASASKRCSLCYHVSTLSVGLTVC